MSDKTDPWNDTARLDLLDRLSNQLNERCGTTYNWRMVTSHLVTRLVVGPGGNGHVGAIDLNDSHPHARSSCRDAIDEWAREHEVTPFVRPDRENPYAGLVEAIRALLDCPDIADNDYKDEETHAAERLARAALAKVRGDG